jgi:integrase
VISWFLTCLVILRIKARAARKTSATAFDGGGVAPQAKAGASPCPAPISGIWSDAGIETAIGCHTFRATGITDYLTNGGRIEVAQHMAGHSNARTTGLYDRRHDDISVGEVERIGI